MLSGTNLQLSQRKTLKIRKKLIKKEKEKPKRVRNDEMLLAEKSCHSILFIGKIHVFSYVRWIITF